MSEQRRSTGPRRGTRQGQPFESEIHINLGIGEIFKGLGNFLDLLGQLTEEGKSEVSRTGEVRGPGGVRGVYGFSIRTNLGGGTTIRRFGNIRATERGPEVSEIREPLVDVFDENDHILVIVELPGVAEGDIRIDVKDDILSLSAEGRDRKYAKEVLLPALVDPANLRRAYQNGVLEIRLGKAMPARSEDL